MSADETTSETAASKASQGIPIPKSFRSYLRETRNGTKYARRKNSRKRKKQRRNVPDYSPSRSRSVFKPRFSSRSPGESESRSRSRSHRKRRSKNRSKNRSKSKSRSRSKGHQKKHQSKPSKERKSSSVTGVFTPQNIQAIHNKAQCCIYVGSLDYHLTEAEIICVFECFGRIVSIDLPKENDRSKGYCFIEYKFSQSAEMAIQTMQGFVLKGRRLRIGRPTATGAEVALTTPDAVANCVYEAQQSAVEAAAYLATKNDFENDLDFNDQHLSLQKGSAKLPEILTKVGGSASLGAAAATALNSSRNFRIEGGGGVNNYYNPVNDVKGGVPSRIYVGNVPLTIDETDLKKIFDVFGSIISCQLVSHPERVGGHRGYGFVVFRQFAHAQLAAKAMNGFQIAGRPLKVNHANGQRGNLMGTMELTHGVEEYAQLAGQIVDSLPNRAVGDMEMANFEDKRHVMPLLKSRILLLKNVVSRSGVDAELKDEMYAECSKYGHVDNITIDVGKDGTDDVSIYVSFMSFEEAHKAFPCLNNRWFAGRQIKCHLVDELNVS